MIDTPVPLQIRVQASVQMRTYISSGISLLQEKGLRSIMIKGMGRAISKSVGIGE